MNKLVIIIIIIIIILSQSKFGLNTQLPSPKLIQRQTVVRNAPKNSQNENKKELWKSTSNHTNIRNDVYRNTTEVLKAIQNEHEDRLRNHLVSQSSFFSNINETSLSSVNSVWSLAQRNLPRNTFNFSIRYINDSLPNRTNLTKYGIPPVSDCSFCLQPESLLHVVAGRGGARNFPTGGLTLPTRGLKYRFQGTVNAKNLRKNRVSPSDEG